MQLQPASQPEPTRLGPHGEHVGPVRRRAVAHAADAEDEPQQLSVGVDKVEELSKVVPVSESPAARQKNPAMAVNQAGEILVAWGEAPGYTSGGELHWQIFSAAGETTSQKGQTQEPMPDFSLPTAVARPDGSFLVIY